MPQGRFSPAQVNFQALADMPGQYQQGLDQHKARGIETSRQDIMAKYQNGGVPDWGAMTRDLLASGDMEGAAKVATMGKSMQPEGMTPYQRESLDIQRQGLQQKAPPVQSFFDDEGRSVKKVWDGQQWKQEGGAKSAPGTANVSAMQEGGRQVMGMVDQLEQKVTTDPALFEEATGPLVNEMSQAPAWRPDRWAYEAANSGKSKAYLDQIKQDAQAINTVMQRNLLKGGGAITENERAQINQILGQIASARSAQDAKSYLDNFRGLVGKIFAMDGEAGTSAPQPQGAMPMQGSGEFQEGAVAENPETGETIVFRNGQWETE